MIKKIQTIPTIFLLTMLHLTACASALHRAAENNDTLKINKLIIHGMNIYARDYFDYTPLHYAAGHGAIQAIDELLKAGVDIDVTAKGGITPLHIACGQYLSYDAGDGSIKTAIYLINKGANIYATNSFGMTPLHNAVRSGRIEVIRLLLEKGVSPNIGENPIEAPLHTIARHAIVIKPLRVKNSIEVAQFLLSKGANINALNKYGNTPLHEAAYYGHYQYIKFLIESGADITIKNKKGETVLSILKYRTRFSPQTLCGLLPFGINNWDDRKMIELLEEKMKAGEKGR